MKCPIQNVGTVAILDVETTSFSPSTEEIIELAISVFRYDRMNGRVFGVVSEYTGMREPTCRISRAAQNVHGISWAILRGLDLNYRRIRGMLKVTLPLCDECYLRSHCRDEREA